MKIVLANHTPIESLPEEERKNPTREPHIICAYCYNDWPCLSKTMADEAQATNPDPIPPSEIVTPGEPIPDPENPTVMRRRTQTF